MTRGDGTEVDVYLDKAFAVVSTVEDSTPTPTATTDTDDGTDD